MILSEIGLATPETWLGYAIAAAIGFGGMKVAISGLAKDVKAIRDCDTGLLGGMRRDIANNREWSDKGYGSNKDAIKDVGSDVSALTKQVESISQRCNTMHAGQTAPTQAEIERAVRRVHDDYDRRTTARSDGQ